MSVKFPPARHEEKARNWKPRKKEVKSSTEGSRRRKLAPTTLKVSRQRMARTATSDGNKRVFTLEHWKFISHKDMEQFGCKPCETDADRLERAKMKLRGAVDTQVPLAPSPRLLETLIRGNDEVAPENGESPWKENAASNVSVSDETPAGIEASPGVVGSPSISQTRNSLSK
eukprot:Gregarina_sp_Poly_1__4614@NODE_246_length_10752_cov_151_576135_g216_i0_p7_GENE_NODE_246_length_10752_cov_151_576135_g216_i0NODE_246_length_10752_cov_151_576135_g216_i0_p7_ORF_typecomplete_len172_score29_59_NODE_246_length_10752_cov_151_576135_g216_i092669781